MNLTFSKKERAFRDEARAWLEANVPKTPLLSGDSREGFAQHVGWEKTMFDARWSVVSWPEQYGGREASLVEWLIFEEEYWKAGAPNRVTQNGIFLLAPTIFEFGTAAQKERLLGDIASASHLWAQGWSEPNAGSDLASVKSHAKKVEGGWKLYGQKTWCTRGAFCDSIFGLCRTDPVATRHRGLTYFMIPLHADGITGRGVARLDGDEGFAEIFLDGVFVPDEDVLGPVNEGWKVAMATTSSERGLSLRSPGRFLATATKLVELYREYRDAGRAELRDRVIRAWMDAEAYRWFTFKTVTRMMKGEGVGAESSLTKVFWSEMDVAMHESALALLGPKAELVGGAPDAEGGGDWMKGFQFAVAGPIYAGTNEIQRNIIAERVLGLPKK